MDEQPSDRSLHADEVGAAGGLGAAAEATTTEIRSLYDEWVGEYDRDVISWGYDAPAKVAGLLAAAVPSGARLLDAGCGTGLTGAALASAGFTNVAGVDASSESVERATTRGVYTDCSVLDLSVALPYEDDVFGGLICCGVLSYLPDVLALVGEFVRVVEPGGTVVFTQRTDLWDERGTPGAIEQLVAAERCAADISEPAPYLPGHPDFGDEIGIRYVTLRVAAAS